MMKRVWLASVLALCAQAHAEQAKQQDGALHINISLSIAEDSSQKVGMLGAGADCSPKTGLGPVRSILPASLCEVTDSLTFRQIEILNCIAEGCSNRDIARQFTISENTVKRHLSNIFHKTGVSTRLELAVFAMAHGIVAAEVNQGETAWRTPSAAASAEQGGTERQHAPFVPLPGRQRAV
jgi:DNA-binding NarL/FixJ family response regulator